MDKLKRVLTRTKKKTLSPKDNNENYNVPLTSTQLRKIKKLEDKILSQHFMSLKDHTKMLAKGKTKKSSDSQKTIVNKKSSSSSSLSYTIEDMKEKLVTLKKKMDKAQKKLNKTKKTGSYQSNSSKSISDSQRTLRKTTHPTEAELRQIIEDWK